MNTARIDIRLESEEKLRFERATALLGYRSLSEYIVKTVSENASKVIESHGKITLSDDVFDRFTNACEKAGAPNKALIEAAKLSEEKGII